MAFPKALTLISLLLVVFVEISKGNANQPSKLDKASATFKGGLKTAGKSSNSGERSVIGYCNYEGANLADSESCSIHYFCQLSGGTPIQEECPYPYKWNPKRGYCDSNYICPLPPVCEYIGQTLPYPEDCSRFYYCDSSTSTIIRMCSVGMFYNSVTQLCDYVENAGCSTRPACVATAQAFSDVYDCTQFYICDANMNPIKYRCPINTSWDSIAEDCVTTYYAFCAN